MRLGFAIAGAVIVLSMAGATVGIGMVQVHHIATVVRHYGHVEPFRRGTITPPPSGKPQTLLLVGSDRRYGDARGDAHSDTLMLVRLDPKQSATTVLSIPRDLRVTIPGHGIDKVNAAYGEGGLDLTTRTVKQLLSTPGQAVPRQPRDRDQLQGLPRRGRHRQLRLHRRRPPLLPLQPRRADRPALRGDRRPARLPAAVRAAGARLRALPPSRQRHRPRRPAAGLPAPGERPAEHQQPAAQPQPAGQGVREGDLLGLEPADQPRHPAVAQARGVLHRAAGAAGPLPPHLRAEHPSRNGADTEARSRRRPPRSDWATM